jgi:hypothetical protein
MDADDPAIMPDATESGGARDVAREHEPERAVAGWQIVEPRLVTTDSPDTGGVLPESVVEAPGFDAEWWEKAIKALNLCVAASTRRYAPDPSDHKLATEALERLPMLLAERDEARRVNAILAKIVVNERESGGIIAGMLSEDQQELAALRAENERLKQIGDEKWEAWMAKRHHKILEADQAQAEDTARLPVLEAIEREALWMFTDPRGPLTDPRFDGLKRALRKSREQLARAARRGGEAPEP